MFLFLFLTPTIFAETAPDIPKGTAEDYFNRGNQYRQQGNLDQAISDYTHAIRVNSKHTKAYYNRANAYSKQEKLFEAIADYKKATEINPQYTEAYYNMGNAYEKQGKREEGIASYTKAIKSNPKYAAAYCNRGNIYQTQGNLKQALDDYNKAVEINPNFAGVYSNRGNVYQAQGNVKQAIADYNKAIELNPTFAGFYANRGNIYQNQGNLKQAIADYNKAVEIDPNDYSTLYNRGLAHYGMEDYDQAFADYQEALNQNPSREHYDNFIKYFPEKRASDKENMKGKIVKIFEDKLNLAPALAALPADSDVAAAKSTDETATAEVAVVPPVVQSPATPQDEVKVDEKQLALKDNKKGIRILLNTWWKSWQTGNMDQYRTCYHNKFRSKNMNLDEWIDYKTKVKEKSTDINIIISNLKITVSDDRNAVVDFIQSYSSSIFKSKGKKTLELKKVGNDWKIYREIS